MIRAGKFLAVAALTMLGCVSLGAQSPPVVAVMNFAITSMSRDTTNTPLEWSLAELLANRLINLQQVEVRDRRVQATSPAQQDAASGSVKSAQYFVLGSVLVLQNQMSVQVKLVEAEGGKVVAQVVESLQRDGDLRLLLDSVAVRISRAAVNKSSGGMSSASGQQARTGNMSDAGTSAVPANTKFSSAGLNTLGRALRLAASGASHQDEAIAMLRSAAAEAPELASDVEQIVKRWGNQVP